MIDYTGITNKQLNIIDDILDCIDFHKIENHMKTVDWQWADTSKAKTVEEFIDAPMYHPNVQELRSRLREMLVREFKAANKGEGDGPYYLSTGGFTVYVWKNNECHVHFSIEDYFGEGDE